ncbi:MAG: hypothetical protein N2V77_03750 [Canidatus Methanoxibalbensis ujae]|nr:hypothetical protein [Candidatus Methanoxibalbensis ujae]
MREVVRVKAPSRLHFSLIDLNGELGRVDGGIGVALEEPHLVIEVSSVAVSSPQDYGDLVERVKEKLGLKSAYEVRVIRDLPSHVGLGSKTQLALSIAKGISTLEHLDISTRDLARIVGRGGTSGIGVAAFERGGFILDAGHRFRSRCADGELSASDVESASDVKTDFLPSSASNVSPPPVLFQHPLPDDWFFVVVTPFVGEGAHGAREVEIFRRYCPIRGEDVGEICRIVLMRILPAIVEKDIETFASGLTMLQHVGFKRIEVEIQHEVVRKLFSFFEKNDAALGYGMSSFGPTTYAVVERENMAKELAADTREFLYELGVRASVKISNTNNRGAEVEVIRHSAASS